MLLGAALTRHISQQSRSSLCRNSKLNDDEVEGGEGPSDSDFGPSGLDQGVELRSVEPGFVPDQNQKRMEQENDVIPQENVKDAADSPQGKNGF